jgi:hypothetical protein
MRYDHEFKSSGESFEARVGAPDPMSAAIGRIALNFAALEAHLTQTLGRLDVDEGWGRLLTAALSCEAKLQLLDERVRLLAPTGMFNTGDIDPLELWAELRAQCARAAQLRAEVLDPAQAEAMLTHILRGRSRRGLGQAQPGLTGTDRRLGPDELLDVADFISMVTMDIEEFFDSGGPTPTREESQPG